VETEDGKSLLLTIKPTTTIAELKDIVLSTEEIPPNSQRLIVAINLNGDKNLKNKST
jgi:hypothetical protein